MPHISSTLRLGAAGAGVAVVPASLSRVAAGDVRCVALSDRRLSAEVALIWRRECPSKSLPHFVREVERITADEAGG